MKYRIKEETNKGGSKSYIVQFRMFFCWFDINDDYPYHALDEAKMAIENYKLNELESINYIKVP